MATRGEQRQFLTRLVAMTTLMCAVSQLQAAPLLDGPRQMLDSRYYRGYKPRISALLREAINKYGCRKVGLPDDYCHPVEKPVPSWVQLSKQNSWRMPKSRSLIENGANFGNSNNNANIWVQQYACHPWDVQCTLRHHGMVQTPSYFSTRGVTNRLMKHCDVNDLECLDREEYLAQLIARRNMRHKYDELRYSDLDLMKKVLTSHIEAKDFSCEPEDLECHRSLRAIQSTIRDIQNKPLDKRVPIQVVPRDCIGECLTEKSSRFLFGSSSKEPRPELKCDYPAKTCWFENVTDSSRHFGPILGPNAPLLGPNAPLLGPNSPLLGPNAPLLGPNAPLLRRNAPLLGLHSRQLDSSSRQFDCDPGDHACEASQSNLRDRLRQFYSQPTTLLCPPGDLACLEYEDKADRLRGMIHEYYSTPHSRQLQPQSSPHSRQFDCDPGDHACEASQSNLRDRLRQFYSQPTTLLCPPGDLACLEYEDKADRLRGMIHEYYSTPHSRQLQPQTGPHSRQFDCGPDDSECQDKQTNLRERLRQFYSQPADTEMCPPDDASCLEYQQKADTLRDTLHHFYSDPPSRQFGLIQNPSSSNTKHTSRQYDLNSIQVNPKSHQGSISRQVVSTSRQFDCEPGDFSCEDKQSNLRDRLRQFYSQDTMLCPPGDLECLEYEDKAERLRGMVHQFYSSRQSVNQSDCAPGDRACFLHEEKFKYPTIGK